ncbi:hypothetical protein SDC9_200170 [bioreactor metagenome]|uniref:Uncharacterized protein n=1 Tax=bioreactor metagenome TaxID=1076179 RepID=A0A645IMI0_9ZZZZ
MIQHPVPNLPGTLSDTLNRINHRFVKFPSQHQSSYHYNDHRDTSNHCRADLNGKLDIIPVIPDRVRALSKIHLTADNKQTYSLASLIGNRHKVHESPVIPKKQRLIFKICSPCDFLGLLLDFIDGNTIGEIRQFSPGYSD